MELSLSDMGTIEEHFILFLLLLSAPKPGKRLSILNS